MKYFSYEPTALVNKLLVQNTQGLRKSLNEIKQQKIKSNKDERNSTNNKNENDRLNTMVSVIDRINQFFKYKFLAGKQPDELQLPKWVKISKKRFDRIKNTVQNAKNNSLRAKPNRSGLINFNESNKLLQDIEHSKITYEEALKRIWNIRSDIAKIINQVSLNLNQVEVINTLFMVDEIFTGEIKTVKANNEGALEVFKEKSDREKQESDEQPDTTNMLELESEESAGQNKKQRGVGLKILTPDQMLSRLSITLVQLKAGNNSQKLINETRKLLYSLYRSKKWTKQSVIIWSTLFKNGNNLYETKNSKPDLDYHLQINLILKTQTKMSH